MLNIISRSIISRHTRGPRKVVLNLIKGLEEIKYPYVVNAALEATKTLWIHDDPQALVKAMSLPSDVAIIAGPNIYTLPSEIPSAIDTSRIIWLHPAKWVQEFWNQSLTTPPPSTVWPVGIDTEIFSPTSNQTKDLILIYNKQRSNEEVKLVCQALEAKGERYEIVTYGRYHEETYRRLLEQSKAMIWVGRSESQGIGLLEALAMDVPTLVWDIKQFGQWVGSGHEQFTKEQLSFPQATASPYFDSSCGVRFSQQTELDSSLAQFLDNLNKFSPRKYVEKELSLAKQANDFLAIYKNHFNQNDAILFNTSLSSIRKWKNASWFFFVYARFKDAIRSIIR